MTITTKISDDELERLSEEMHQTLHGVLDAPQAETPEEFVARVRAYGEAMHRLCILAEEARGELDRRMYEALTFSWGALTGEAAIMKRRMAE